MSCLYSVDINPLLVILFANIFSHSVGWLFVLWMVSFAVQKLLSLIRLSLFIFALISFALGEDPKRLLWFMSKYVLPMFSSRSFMILGWGSRQKHPSPRFFLKGDWLHTLPTLSGCLASNQPAFRCWLLSSWETNKTGGYFPHIFPLVISNNKTKSAAFHWKELVHTGN